MKKLERAPSILNIFPAAGALQKILHDSQVQEVLSKITEEHYYWDKVKFQPLPPGIKHTDIWFIIKSRRRSGIYQASFGKYRFSWSVTNRMQEALHFFDMHIGGTLGSGGLVAGEDRQRYMISSLMEEAIASSQIEGAVTTRAVAKEMLRRNRKPVNKSEQMILNNYLTIQKILEIKEEPLGMDNLLAIHKLVSTDTMSDKSEEGALREDDSIAVYDVATGEIVHQPPKRQELEAMLTDLFRFFNEDDPKRFIHPLLKACILHFMIGFIHPFVDGNGRTARALFYWYLLRRGYWLTEHLSISRLILKAKAQYAKAFQYTEIDDHDLTYFMLYNLKVMKDAFEELRLYIARKQDEKKRANQFLKLEGVNRRQALILDWFDKEPDLLLTIKEAQSRLATTHQTARTDLAQLSQSGYLTMIALDGKSKAFQKAAAFEQLIKNT